MVRSWDVKYKEQYELKECIKCGEDLPLSEFYRHKMMADGHLNKCKSCCRKKARENRAKKIEYYRAYDRARGCRQTPEYLKEHRRKYPQQTKAQQKVAYEISAGNLTPKPCENCGANNRQHAHHDDYSKPLDIRWLCPACHKQWHDKNGEGLNRS